MNINEFADNIHNYESKLSSDKERLARMGRRMDAAKTHDEMSSVQNDLISIINETGKIAAEIDQKISSLEAHKAKLLPIIDSKDKKIAKKTLQELRNLQNSFQKLSSYAKKAENALESSSKNALRSNLLEETQGPVVAATLNRMLSKANSLAMRREAWLREQAAQFAIPAGTKMDAMEAALRGKLAAAPEEKKAQIRTLIQGVEEYKALQKMDSLVANYARTELSRPIKEEDIWVLVQLRTIFARERQDETARAAADPQARALLGEMESFVGRQLQETQNTLSRTLQALLHLDPDHAAALRDFQTVRPSSLSTQDGLKMAKMAHDLYWMVSSPIEAHLGIEGVSEIGLSALKNSEHPFHEALSQLSEQDRNILQERLAMLANPSASDAIKNLAVGPANQTICHKFPEEMARHKTEYLRNVLAHNRAAVPTPALGIIGGGPGGLVRALVAGLKGADVQLLEFRETYTRQRIIKLQNIPLLQYLGIEERLLCKGDIHNVDRGGNEPIQVELQSLEKVMRAMTEELLGPRVAVQGGVLDLMIGVNPNEAGAAPKTAYLYQETQGPKRERVGGPQWRQADVIVDATGARGVLAEKLLVPSTQLSTPQMMVTAVREAPPGGGRSVESSHPTVDTSFHFSTPQHEYFLLQPNEAIQEQMQAIQDQNRSLQAEISRLDPFVKELKKKLEDSSTDTSRLEYLQGKILAQLDPDARTKVEKAPPEKRFETAIKLAEKKLKKPKATLEKNQKESDKLMMQLVSADLGASKPPTLVEKPTAFPTQVTERSSPSQIFGTALILQSGDAMATPDPKSASGANHAIRGAQILSRVIDDLQHQSSLASVKTVADYGTTKIARGMETASFTARSELAKELVEAGKKSPEEDQLTATFDYLLRVGNEAGLLTDVQVAFLRRYEQNISHDIPIDPAEKRQLQTLSADLEQRIRPLEERLKTSRNPLDREQLKMLQALRTKVRALAS